MDGIPKALAADGRWLQSTFETMGLSGGARAVTGLVAAHPIPVLAILAGLCGLLALIHFRGRTRIRRLQRTLDAQVGSIPCRSWPHLGRVDATLLLAEPLRVFGRRLDAEGAAAHYGALGLLYLQRGDGHRAEKMLAKAVELFEIANVREGIAVYGRYLSLLYREHGDIARAKETAERALAMYQTLAIEPDGAETPPSLRLREIAAAPRTGSDPLS